MASNFDFPNSSFEPKASGDDRREESVQELTKEQRHLLLEVFPELSGVKSDDPRKGIGFPALSAFLDTVLDKQAEEHKNEDYTGYLGPKDVLFDITANVGTLLVEADRFGVASHSNFCTIRANGCVYKGKWVYEVMLGSKGVMQLGWSTINCTFSQEEGVGDTANSYAYDGNRLRKWNMKTQRYGQGWLTGDIISCGIDCDEGTVTFFRNGQSMGTAFSNLRLGKEMAYFPAVSLSFGENIRVNFGATPLKYPIEGYKAMQAPPMAEVRKAWTLLAWVDRLMPLIEKENKQSSVAVVPEALPVKSDGRSRKATLLLLMGHVFEKLAPLLTKAYVVEECLLKYLLRHCHHDNFRTENNIVMQMMNMLWMYTQEFELKPCLEYLAIGLLAGYRFSPITTNFSEQKKYLTLLLVILRHADIRKHLVNFVLFDKIKFPIFMHIKPADDASLAEFIPEVWWAEAKEDEEDEDSLVEPVLDMKQRLYLDACETLRRKVKELEDIQVEILRCFMIDKDGKRGSANTRHIFLQKLKEFLKENMMSGRVHPVQQCPLPVILCLFHRMIRLLRSLWDDHVTSAASRGLVNSDNARVAEWIFADDSQAFLDIQRFGGVMSHLKKEHKDLLIKSSDYRSQTSPLFPPASLLELLDGTIMLFDIGAYKQLGKMASLHDTMKEYVLALQDAQSKIDRASSEMREVLEELHHARTVFLEKSAEQARQRAWLIAVVYSKEKQLDVQWIMETAMRSIEQATVFFPFIPEYYIDVCINGYNALKHYFNPVQPFRALGDLERIHEEFARFLAKHFANNQIVNTDTRDNIVQALACFICYKKTLTAVENMQPKLVQDMVRSLITPYENRSWAQTNWILVRLWKGNGFAFRYVHLPHLIPAKAQAQDIANASLQKPHPSQKLQDLLGKELLFNEEAGSKFIDSVLNQLNWAFSEFIGMLQELQTIAARPERNIVDPRQLKICATCFDISVGLLRVLEMVVAKVPQLFLDRSKPNSESLLTRLLQLLCQVLNRVTAKRNLFENIVSAGMPGLESVDHFPVLAAVCGVLVQLLGSKVPPDRRECALSALLNEPGFQMSSVEFLLGGTLQEGNLSQAAGPISDKTFSLRKYQEVNATETKEVEDILEVLKKSLISRQRTSSFSEDEECTICYAHAANCIFHPCKHTSCKTCISHHLMSHKECFFCKSTITKVLDNNGKVVPIKSGKS